MDERWKVFKKQENKVSCLYVGTSMPWMTENPQFEFDRNHLEKLEDYW